MATRHTQPVTLPTSRALAAAALGVAVLALLVATLAAVGGASYAGGLAKGVVGKAQLKKNAVTSVKVKDGSLTAADFAVGQLPAGPRGPSDVWSTSLEGFNDTRMLLPLSLPAGRYYVSARASMYSSNPDSAGCTLSAAGKVGDRVFIATPGSMESSGHLQGVFVLTQAGAVTLDCPDALGVDWGRARVDALAVASVH